MWTGVQRHRGSAVRHAGRVGAGDLLALNCTYLHLTRLGVQPVERLMLCHLAANAVEDAYGTGALSITSSGGGGLPGTPEEPSTG